MGASIITTGCLGQHPVIRDTEQELVHACDREQGGTKTVGIPEYTLVVTNLEQPQE